MTDTEFRPKAGDWFDALPNEVYHGGPGLSSSQLKALVSWSPRFAHETMNTEWEPSDSMKRGTLAHTLILEPDEVDKRYYFAPGFKKVGKGWAEKWAEIEEAAAGREIIRDDVDEMRRLADSVTGHPVWKHLTGGDPIFERSYYFESERGTLLKCRPDAARDLGNKVIRVTDLKTCNDPRPGPFAAQAARLGYGFQAAWYCWGIEQVTGCKVQYLWVAVRSKFPHAVGVYDATKWVAVYDRRVRNAVATYEECERVGRWPELNKGRVIPLDLPSWDLN